MAVTINLTEDEKTTVEAYAKYLNRRGCEISYREALSIIIENVGVALAKGMDPNEPIGNIETIIEKELK